MSSLTYTATYTVIVCTHEGCGLRYALDDQFIRARRDDHATFYCPNGHGRWYPPGSSEVEKLRAKLDQAEADARWQRERRSEALREAEHQRARAAGYKGAAAKAKKRAAKGVCPAPGCKRSFVDVARHVASQHPELMHEHEETPDV